MLGETKMKKLFKKALAVFLSVLMAASFTAFPLTASAAQSKKESKKIEYAEGEVIAVLNEGVKKNYLLAGTSSYGKGIKLKASHSFSGKKSEQLNVAVLKSGTLSTKEIIKKLKSNPGVKYAFPNYKRYATAITSDEYSKYQWALDNTGQNGGKVNSDLNAEALWDMAKKSDKEQIVAIADTGIDFENPEFEDLIWTNTYGTKLVGKHGYDFSGTNEDGVPRDGNGHGTHCAGIIAAAANNGKGISGINQSNVKIMPLKWLDDEGGGYDEDVLAAYDYISRAMDLGANVTAINNSWGGEGDYSEQMLFDEVFDRLGEKGAVSVIAAGNESADLSEHSYESFFGMEEGVYTIPACSESRYALTVAATNEKDELADFSNYSPEYVDVAAPGVDILSTVSYYCYNPSIYSDEKNAEITDKFQDFNSSFSEGDFGYPTVVKPSEEMDGSDNLEITLADSNFGTTDGKCLAMKSKDVFKKNSYFTYAFEIPFTIEDETMPYSVSFMCGGLKDSYVTVFDVPADAVLEDVVEGSYQVLFGGSETANYWSHEFFTSNEVDEDGEPYDDEYVQSTDRKLVFLCEANSEDTDFRLDDLAISKQGVDEEEFEKYDFYCGTSMATPYVAGAVALLKNAFSDASTFDVVNMVKNAGRYNEDFEELTSNAKLLSLEDPEKMPPFIFGASYTSDGKVEITGSFRNITRVSVNDLRVNPVSVSNSKIIINDNNYDTKRSYIEVSNALGSDGIAVLLSKKKTIPVATDVMGEPSYVSGGVMLPVDDSAYYINKFGTVGRMYYDEYMSMYVYEDGTASVDFDTIFKGRSTDDAEITSAVYTGGKIYFTVLNPVVSANGTVIGTDSAFGSIDLTSYATAKLSELPEAAVYGGSLAAYNGEVYLAGGFSDGEFDKTVLKYNTAKKAFEKLSKGLPEGRAYTKFIQYENKLYGVYGAVESGEMPTVITFDGSSWTKSKAVFDSDDCYEYYYEDGSTLYVYEGNVGYGNGGIFCSGPYVYGRGDSFTYKTDGTVVNSDYAVKNSFEDSDTVGTTLPGCYVAFPVEDELDDLDGIVYSRKAAKGDSFDDFTNTSTISPDMTDSTIYKLKMPTSYAKLTPSVFKGAESYDIKSGYTYGEVATFSLEPEYGYAISSISVNGKVVSKNKTSASARLVAPDNKVAVAVTYLIPGKVTKLKAKAKGNKVNLKWKKVANAQGYQVQIYKKGKWKTLKKVTSLKYTAKKLKNGKFKFRVRAYRKYGSETYYGAWSKAKKVKGK